MLARWRCEQLGAEATAPRWISQLDQGGDYGVLPAGGAFCPGFDLVGYGRAILKHGCEYKNRRPPADLEIGPDAQCFPTAQRLAREHGWRYVEGFSDEPARPGEFKEGWNFHAWCLDEEGHVDVGWPYWSKRRYFGIEFPVNVQDLPEGTPWLELLGRNGLPEKALSERPAA
jgi:hypothetical protein